ncbi:MAG: hypothetical protein IJ680_06985, partial [Paludibacteraceae bacterium]|nr:hypothetical protein [Paludibacteraceae bacterium]
IAENLMAELAFKSLMSDKKVDEEKVAEIAQSIQQHEQDFIARVSHSSGKAPQMVKAYYAALYKDWDESVGKIFDQVESL